MVKRFLFCNKYTSLYNNVIKSTAKSLHYDCPRVESLSYNCISSKGQKAFLYLLLSPHSGVPSATDAKSQNFLSWEVCNDEGEAKKVKSDLKLLSVFNKGGKVFSCSRED